jgi:serine phosphatase RsbU (regulator of sigma subunit)
MKKFLHTVFEAGVYTDLPEAEKKRIRLLNRLVVLACMVMLLFGLLDLATGYYEMTLFAVFICSTGFIEQYLVKKRWYTAAKHVTFLVMWGTLFTTSLLVGGQAGAQYMFVPLAMYPLMIYSSRKTALVVFILIYGGFVLVHYLQQEIEPWITLPAHLVPTYILAAAFNMMLITYLFTSYGRSVNESYEKMILEKSDQLSEAYKDITDSIAYAKRIQDAYLPPPHVLNYMFPQSFLLFQPKDVVSGDFYWFYTFKDENGNISPESYLAVADCTGHGVPGSIMSVICCNALNEVVITRQISDVGKILDEVRTTVIRMLKSDSHSNQKDGMDIALVKINRETGQLHYSGANNPLWIIQKNVTSHNNLIELKADKQPIGMFPDMKPFSSHEIQLKKGDLVFLTSDGYADQFGGPKGKKFKYSNLQKILLENSNVELQTLNLKLQTIFNTWRGDLEQVDDICLIGVSI